MNLTASNGTRDEVDPLRYFAKVEVSDFFKLLLDKKCYGCAFDPIASLGGFWHVPCTGFQFVLQGPHLRLRSHCTRLRPVFAEGTNQIGRFAAYEQSRREIHIPLISIALLLYRSEAVTGIFVQRLHSAEVTPYRLSYPISRVGCAKN